MLIDGADYFARLEEACRQAQRSILVLGWDFDHRINLRPDDPSGLRLGAFLRQLVEARPALEIRLLIWSFAFLHAPSEPLQLLLGADWARHPRIQLKLDRQHPFYAAHHQKLITIDDAVAFAGGMDLTVRRWDRSVHTPAECLRVDPDQRPYRPMHDVQMMVDGEAAQTLAELARERWRRACDEVLQPFPKSDPWPHDLVPDFEDVDIGIARTFPHYRNIEEVREVEALTRDCLSAARNFIYIEAQYMTNEFVGDILAGHLRNPVGPEILVLMTRDSRGIIESLIMGHNRDGLIRRLKKQDFANRLRVCYPVNEQSQILVHSKVIIIDDRFLRIGSSNLNNRSMGLDSECDLAIEGATEKARRAIAGVKWRLVGEHLGINARTIAAAADHSASTLDAIESFNHGARGLRCFEALHSDGRTEPAFGTSLLDPDRSFSASFSRAMSKLR